MERVAEAAARESQELKMVEYLAAFAGQSFSAVISGVAAWGLYVRLDCTAEGILPVRALGDELSLIHILATTFPRSSSFSAASRPRRPIRPVRCA